MGAGEDVFNVLHAETIGMNVYQLKGYSGCKLEILQNGNSRFVRKTVGGSDQNGKLYDELEKL